MSKDFSASKSQQTGTSSTATAPFDAIVALEEQEKKRVQVELDALQDAEIAARQTCEKKEVEAEQALKEAAKEDLKKFREKELPPILKKGEKNADAACKKLDEAYKSQSDKLAKSLAEQLAKSDSPLGA